MDMLVTVACMQAPTEVYHRRATQGTGMRDAHDVHALRGEALRKSDLIADLRASMQSSQVPIAEVFSLTAASRAHTCPQCCRASHTS